MGGPIAGFNCRITGILGEYDCPCGGGPFLEGNTFGNATHFSHCSHGRFIIHEHGGETSRLSPEHSFRSRSFVH